MLYGTRVWLLTFDGEECLWTEDEIAINDALISEQKAHNRRREAFQSYWGTKDAKA